MVYQLIKHLHEKEGLGYRRISQEIKNKFSRKIDFSQVYRILQREHNAKLVVAERNRRLVA